MVDAELSRSLLEAWYLDLPPAWVTACNLHTGQRIREPSLTAARVKPADLADREFTGPVTSIEKFLAAGQEAQSYGGRPGTAVFSPLRRGHIACYDGAHYLFRTLLRKISSGPLPVKPVVLVRMGEDASQVEKIALTDAAMQAGARRVLLYREPLEALLESVREQKALQRALVLHIEP